MGGRSRPLLRRGLDRWRAWRCAAHLRTGEGDGPSLARVVSQAVTERQCEDPRYAAWCEVIRERPRRHRKQWEYVYILCALDQAGMLRPGRSGIGFGVGREPLVATLAARGCTVLATDLPPGAADAAAWKATGEYGGDRSALNERGLCSAADFAARVAYRHVDMRDLSGLEGDVDFVWSSCAMEHLGSLDAGTRFVLESLSLVRPGGIAVHTTELNACSNTATVESGPVVLYRRRDLEALARAVRDAGGELVLDFHTGNGPCDRRVDVPPFDEERHLKVLYSRFATTSFGILVRRRA